MIKIEYPTLDQVFAASPEQIIIWWRNLGAPAPGNRDEQIVIMWITRKYKELTTKPEFEQLEKTVVWNKSTGDR